MQKFCHLKKNDICYQNNGNYTRLMFFTIKYYFFGTFSVFENDTPSFVHDIFFEKKQIYRAWRKKIAILIQMQFLNDIIKSEHGFKVAKKSVFQSLDKNSKLIKFLSTFKAMF